MHRSIAAGLAGLGLALAAPAAAQEDATPEVATTIGEWISDAFAAELETLGAMDCADDDIACLSAELLERYRVDQWARGEAMGGAFCADYSGELAQNCFGQAMGATAFKVDMPNTARLKQVIALHGWPKPPLFSEAAQNAAWYLAQHAMALDGNGNLIGRERPPAGQGGRRGRATDAVALCRDVRSHRPRPRQAPALCDPDRLRGRQGGFRRGRGYRPGHRVSRRDRDEGIRPRCLRRLLRQGVRFRAGLTRSLAAHGNAA